MKQSNNLKDLTNMLPMQHIGSKNNIKVTLDRVLHELNNEKPNLQLIKQLVLTAQDLLNS